MFEYSYLLPSTFLVVIFNFILFKKIFKDHIYKIFGISFISLSFFLVSVFSGFVKFKNIEIYSYRLYANEIIKFSKKK